MTLERLIQADHRVDLCGNLGLHLLDDFVLIAGFVCLSFAQDENHRPLDVATFRQFGGGLGRNIPSRHNLKASTPEYLSHVRPNRSRLVREHDYLHPILRHVISHGRVGPNHTLPEFLALSLDGKRTSGIP